MMLSIDYIAGFIDGEGCLGIVKKGGRYRPQIDIGNTNIDIMKALEYTFHAWGIATVTHTVTMREGNRKDFYRICVDKMDSVYQICQILRPYLKIKQANANAIINFIEARRMEGYRQDTLKDIKMAAVNDVKQLNKRGKN